ncbi:MAG: hypothetical protein QNJ44_10510 [Rhodobacter sp.]|nr:hypothetical protein [Rhodobacter sp.]
MRIALLLSALAAPIVALAETPMTAAEFEAYVAGRTLTFIDRGVPYGVEEYLPGRRVRWAYIGDQCRDGYWYDAGDQICFVYENNPEPQCWIFTRAAGRLGAKFMGDDDGRQLYEAAQSDEPLICPGPDVGV